MSLTSTYLITTKNLNSIINSVVSAKAPDRFNNKFLEDLGFKSSNDRLYVGLFKALGLIDESGMPTNIYHKFIDQSETSSVLSECIQVAYEDLFNLRRDAQNLSLDEAKGKIKTLTQGQKSEKVITLMASTFKALCEIATWNKNIKYKNENIVNKDNLDPKPKILDEIPKDVNIENKNNKVIGLNYDIQIHLPETTNMAVYDAIFQSLKKHLF